MSPFIATITQLISLGTIGAQVLVAILLALLVFSWNAETAFIQFVKKYAMAGAFCVAIFTTIFSLFFSEIAGFEPCKLCWIQRIFMFPQVFILGIAWLKKDVANAVTYGIALSGIGLFVAGYQILLQMGAVPNIICAAAAVSISCGKVFFTDFGYITIPVMSATAFALLLILLLIAKRRTS